MNPLRRALVGLTLAAAIGARSPTTSAQAPGRVARVGWLGWDGAADGHASAIGLEGFRAGLAERGWVEGRTLALEIRSGDRDRARELAAELVRAKVELLVAQGPMVFSARSAAAPTPVLFGINGDPVEAGLVASLARPGGNLTGATAMVPELAGKRVELLKEVLPRAKRLAALANQAHPGLTAELRETRSAAQRLGMDVELVPVRSVADFAGAFDAIARARVDAIVAFPDTLINSRARAVAEFAVRNRLSAVSGWKEFAEAGNLLSYGPGQFDFWHLVAGLADDILRGVPAGDVAVVQPTRFELAVNERAARALGLTLPRGLLLRANDVIR